MGIFRNEMLAEIRPPLATTVELVARHPLRYGMFAVLVVLIRVGWALISLEGLDGKMLYFVAWSTSFAEMALRFAVYVSLLGVAVPDAHGERPPPQWRSFFKRYVRALPYGFLLFYCLDQLRLLLWWGMDTVVMKIFGNGVGAVSFSVTLHLAALPFLLLLCRLGFSLVAAATGDRLTFVQSWRRSRGKGWPLFLSILLWWCLKSLPGEITPYISFDLARYYPWFSRPFLAMNSVFFTIVAAAWYVRLQSGGKGLDAAASSQP